MNKSTRPVSHLECGVGEYRGTADQLISAGIVAANELPGQPGVPRKTTLHVRRPDGREISVYRYGRSFHVYDRGIAHEEYNAAIERMWNAIFDPEIANHSRAFEYERTLQRAARRLTRKPK